MKRTLGPLLLLATLFVSGAAIAQEKPAKKGQPKVIKIDTITVEGQVQKPQAFYILQRSELTFQGLEPKKSFVPLILRSVEKEPF
ncbi:MAG: hypothetical protein KC620_04240 [Myxococcales bacterium]|nr:hypothetical protein [Myxococcales bacterium]